MTTMERVPMTIEGYKKLEAELHRLKVEERPRIIQLIAEATSPRMPSTTRPRSSRV